MNKTIKDLLYNLIPGIYWRWGRMYAHQIRRRVLALDPRIDPRSYWLWIVDSQAELPRWHVKAVSYDDPTESGGNHNIYVTVLDEQGAPLDGIPVWQKWPGAAANEARQKTNAGVTNFGIYGGPFYPSRGEAGAYWVYVGDDPAKSDVVYGMGLPVNQHVNYHITVQRVVADQPTPPPTGGGVSEARSREIAREEISKARLTVG